MEHMVPMHPCHHRNWNLLMYLSKFIPLRWVWVFDRSDRYRYRYIPMTGNLSLDQEKMKLTLHIYISANNEYVTNFANN